LAPILLEEVVERGRLAEEGVEVPEVETGWEEREVGAEGWWRRRNFMPELPVMKAEMWELVGGCVSRCLRYLFSINGLAISTSRGVCSHLELIPVHTCV
jgi:hypothetical protein